MSPLHRFLAILLLIVLAACSRAPSGFPTAGSATQVIAVSPVFGTAISGSVSGGTVEPVIVTLLPPNYTPPPTDVPPTLTPIPTISGGFSPTELKYLVLAQFPNLFFCDPDDYPVARTDVMELARERFPELQANSEEFNAILAHKNLTGLSVFSDEQKLLIYQEHKRLAALQFTLANQGYQFQLQSAKTEGDGELITGLIDSQGVITVQQTQPTIATCPICLARGTRIDTPNGSIPVEDLRPGMQVWTETRLGLRIATLVLRVNETFVPADHQVIHLRLEDGRELWVSPGHPTADGRTVGQLRKGDLLNGMRVVFVEQVVYTGAATYDLLPAGETGFYWADGILIASTLSPR